MAGKTRYQRWLDENPNGTPYEALMAGVIDQDKFSELTKEGKENETEKYEKLMAESEVTLTDKVKLPATYHEAGQTKASPKVTIIETARATPKLGTPTPTKNDMGYLYNKKSGKSTRMSMVAIMRMVSKMPHLYEQR